MGLFECLESQAKSCNPICHADELLAKRLHVKPVAEAANTGTGSVSELVATCKKYAPPLPKECAALKFSSYLFKDGSFGVKA